MRPGFASQVPQRSTSAAVSLLRAGGHRHALRPQWLHLIATSEDDHLDRWSKCPANPVIPIPKEGDPGFGEYNVHDPPHVWLDGDTYDAIHNGRGPRAWDYDHAYLFKSNDLANWAYLHLFYEPNPAWTFADEDCACPGFFKLGDRRMLLVISHSRGARYYWGRYENEAGAQAGVRASIPSGLRTCCGTAALVFQEFGSVRKC